MDCIFIQVQNIKFQISDQGLNQIKCNYDQQYLSKATQLYFLI
jgi:hypothetical protein